MAAKTGRRGRSPRRGLPLFALFAALLLPRPAPCEHVMRLPAPGAKERVEEVAMAEPFAAGRLAFRAEDPKTRAVFSVYETALRPEAALAEIALGLAADGWREVFATASMRIFESGAGRCAVAQAYAAEGATRAAVLIQR